MEFISVMTLKCGCLKPRCHFQMAAERADDRGELSCIPQNADGFAEAL